MTSARDVIAKWLAVHWGVQHTVGNDELMDADAILAALDAAGFVCVPKEPTEAMLSAGIEIRREEYSTKTIYRAMLTAAKEPTP